jgi:DNA-binding MarR family transcriptional regulator
MAGGEPDDAAARAWRAMSALVLDQDLRAAVTAELGLSFARVRALRRLVGAPCTLRELAARLNADPPYATVIVDDLEGRGLVARTPHPDDRRAKLVSLTDDGRAAAARANAILGEPPAAMRALPPDELATLARVLEKIRDADPDRGA